MHEMVKGVFNVTASSLLHQRLGEGKLHDSIPLPAVDITVKDNRGQLLASRKRVTGAGTFSFTTDVSEPVLVCFESVAIGGPRGRRKKPSGASAPTSNGGLDALKASSRDSYQYSREEYSKILTSGFVGDLVEFYEDGSRVFNERAFTLEIYFNLKKQSLGSDGIDQSEVEKEDENTLLGHARGDNIALNIGGKREIQLRRILIDVDGITKRFAEMLDSREIFHASHEFTKLRFTNFCLVSLAGTIAVIVWQVFFLAKYFARKRLI
jgi:hypothetical protein